MSITCPRCRLLNPPEALRCDCGYDFATQTVKSSYLVDHQLRKYGGDRRALASVARWHLRTGGVLLAFAGFIGATGYVGGGRATVWGWPIAFGTILVYRGVRLRRRARKLVEGIALTPEERKGLSDRLP